MTVKKPRQRKPMPRPTKAIPSAVDRERRKRWNAYLALFKRMMDKEDLCQG